MQCLVRWPMCLVTMLVAALPAAAGEPAERSAAGGPWYVWQPENSAAPGEIGLQEWLEKPAGKHGRIWREGEQLVYHGRPIKLWGINVCFSSCAPDKSLAERRAAFYAKYGVNSVRLHKYADGPGWAGIQSPDSSAEYDPEGLDRMDYFVAKLKESGIYVTLSAHFGTIKLGPADRRDVPFLEEFGTFDSRKNRIAAPHSALFYSPDLQKLHIRQMVNLLRHRNPYTGLTYAEDPAVCTIEIINEQSILFYTSMAPLQASATLRKQVGERFTDWLVAKYGSAESLREAWGPKALGSFRSEVPQSADESPERRNILPLGNPWFWDPQQLAGSQSFRRQRLLDTLRFLYELQCEAYDRYVEAVRAAGYEGELLGSNWQAGRALSHYANLHTDYRVGIIDRHNYFGGQRRGGQQFNNGSLLTRPGSGTLSSGLQQVIDRPFMLSEWIHVFPNEWGVEGPAVIGAYGLGLQGWDASYMFQNRDAAAFSTELGEQAWDVMAPQILGVFPAVARQVLRGDVKQSDEVAVRNVHVPSLFAGKLGFDDKVVQGYDEKELDSSKVPARALAVARCAVAFTDTDRETPVFSLQRYQEDGFLVSTTGQLRWKDTQAESDQPAGYFTIDTPGTQAVVGFAQDQTCRLQTAAITPHCRFAAIYVTVQQKEGTLDSSPRLLVVALARARNSGMRLNAAENELLDRGKSPILMEPVRATIRLQRPGDFRVVALDHDGNPTTRTLSVQNGEFTIDGARDRTPYYLIRYDAK